MKTRYGYSTEASWLGTSNDYQQHMFSWRNKKSINTFGVGGRVGGRVVHSMPFAETFGGVAHFLLAFCRKILASLDIFRR